MPVIAIQTDSFIITTKPSNAINMEKMLSGMTIVIKWEQFNMYRDL